MDVKHFDRFMRALSDSISRRSALGTLGGLAAIGFAGGAAKHRGHAVKNRRHHRKKNRRDRKKDRKKDRRKDRRKELALGTKPDPTKDLLTFADLSAFTISGREMTGADVRQALNDRFEVLPLKKSPSWIHTLPTQTLINNQFIWWDDNHVRGITPPATFDKWAYKWVDSDQIVYKQDPLVAPGSLVLIDTTLINDEPYPVTLSEELKVSWSQQHTTVWDFTYGMNLSLSYQHNQGVNFAPNFSIGGSFSWTWHWQNSTTDTKTVETTVTATVPNVPGKSRVRVQVIGTHQVQTMKWWAPVVTEGYFAGLFAIIPPVPYGGFVDKVRRASDQTVLPDTWGYLDVKDVLPPLKDLPPGLPPNAGGYMHGTIKYADVVKTQIIIGPPESIE